MSSNGSEKKYSNFIARVAASIIDSYFLELTTFLLGKLIFGDSLLLNKILGIVIIIHGVLYIILCHKHFGATVGKKFAGIKVVDVVTEESIRYIQAIMRDIFPICIISIFIVLGALNMSNNVIDTLFLYVYFSWVTIEIVTMLFNEKRRSFHDYIAGTVVIRA